MKTLLVIGKSHTRKGYAVLRDKDGVFLHSHPSQGHAANWCRKHDYRYSLQRLEQMLKEKPL